MKYRHDIVKEQILRNRLQDENFSDVWISYKHLLAIKLIYQILKNWRKCPFKYHLILEITMVYTWDSLHYFSIDRSRLVGQMKKGPSSLATQMVAMMKVAFKLNLLLVRLLGNDLGYVQVQLFDICCSKFGNAEILFQNISNAVISNKIDWSSCVGLNLDNTSVNLGRHNSIKMRGQVVKNVVLVILLTTRQIEVLKCLCRKVVLILRTCLLI